ncbi:hypothetical protein AB0H76_34985 [Nocardia sp. NPDC050712]|uniref:hypothetical protein n=1 Tax=Nocardia sp. NPDC050712 TaxID=3155518 RepID=UPI0033C2BB10
MIRKKVTVSDDDSTNYVEKQPASWAWQLGIIPVSLLLLGCVTAAATIAALAGGFNGWSWIAGIVTVAVFAAAGCAFAIGNRRNKGPHTEVYSPDNPAALQDRDRTDNQSHRL